MPSSSLPHAFLLASSSLPHAFLLASYSLPPACLMPYYSLPPAFLLHSISEYTHIYIAGYFSTPEKYPFYTFTLFKKLFSENIWSFGLEFITLQPDTSKRRRNNGNDRRQLYSRAPKQRKRKCVLYSLFDLWSNC